MPQYSGTHAMPRLDLGVAFEEFSPEGIDFVGTQVLPIFETERREAKFSAITRESILRTQDTKRALKSAYNRDDYEAEDKSYECWEHGVEQLVDDVERAMYANDFDADMHAVQIGKLRLMITQEQRYASLLFNTGTWTGASLYTDLTNDWDGTDATPIDDVQAAKEKVRTLVGIEARAMLIGKVTLNNLLKHADVVDNIKYTVIPTMAAKRAALAALLDIDEMFVGNGVYNSAAEGASYSGSDIWSDDYALIFVRSRGAGLASPGLGRTFLWTADSPDNLTVEQYREEQVRSDVFRVRQNVDELVFDASFGHLLKVDT